MEFKRWRVADISFLWFLRCVQRVVDISSAAASTGHFMRNIEPNKSFVRSILVLSNFRQEVYFSRMRRDFDDGNWKLYSRLRR